MKKWDIAYNELKIKNMIGKGRFSTVYRGFWHGNIAIKFLNMNYHPKDEKTLEKFRSEVRTYMIMLIILKSEIVNSKKYFMIRQ